jgi:hypothetical protein
MIQSEFRSGLVAQLVEQRTENPRVGGSIPSQATNFPVARAEMTCLGVA